MRGKLREKPRRNGRSELFIDYYPPVWNPQTQKFIRQENLKLYLINKPTSAFEKGQNAVSRKIAEKIYLERMKALMLEEGKSSRYFADQYGIALDNAVAQCVSAAKMADLVG